MAYFALDCLLANFLSRQKLKEYWRKSGTLRTQEMMRSNLHFDRVATGAAATRATPVATPSLAVALRTMRDHWAKLTAISAVAIIPCFWHPHIEAGDLGSHVYNAWLVQLIQKGQAPGLWIARQWSNILFDLLLSNLGSVFGLRVAEKIAVALAVLILFWGAFALIAAATRRAPWRLTPVLAMITYGWTFHAGFFNYYLSIGLAFVGLALFWRGSFRERFIALCFAPLIYLAHPLGAILLFGASAYVAIAEKLHRRYHMIHFVVPAALLVGLHFYLAHHYQVSGVMWPLYLINGADQFVLFGHRYMILYFAFLLFALIAMAVDISRRPTSDVWSSYGVVLQLYLLTELGVFLLPNVIQFSSSGAPLGYLVERLSLVSATLLACMLGAMRPRTWHASGFGAIVIVFFIFLYQDTALLNRMEKRVEQLIATIPPGQRVMETIIAPPEWRVKFINHMVDRACIVHCFAYGNYEPSSEQFRVRANPGNAIVMNWPEDMGSMEEGDYEVQEEDLPAYQIYQCSADVADLCIRELAAEEKIDRLGIHPNHTR